MYSCCSGTRATGKTGEWQVVEDTIQFMTMLHSFIRGWDESEFPPLLKELDRRFGIKAKAARLFAVAETGDIDMGGSGKILASEMELRLFARCLTWDLAGNDYGHRAVSRVP